MLSEAEIKRFIEEDATSEKKLLAKEGQRYYEGEHDIKDYRMFYTYTETDEPAESAEATEETETELKA